MVVARTAHRDNKSDYYVDGRKSTFTAVTALLKGKGIDLDNNRFLILQVSLDYPTLCTKDWTLTLYTHSQVFSYVNMHARFRLIAVPRR